MSYILVNLVYHSINENTEMCEKLKSYYIPQLFNLILEVIPEIYKFIITLNIKRIRISEEVPA